MAKKNAFDPQLIPLLAMLQEQEQQPFQGSQLFGQEGETNVPLLDYRPKASPRAIQEPLPSPNKALPQGTPSESAIPSLEPKMPSAGSVGTRKVSPRQRILDALGKNLLSVGTTQDPISERFPMQARSIYGGNPSEVEAAVGEIQRMLGGHQFDPNSLIPKPLQRGIGHLMNPSGGSVANRLLGHDEVRQALEELKAPQPPAQDAFVGPLQEEPEATGPSLFNRLDAERGYSVEKKGGFSQPSIPSPNTLAGNAMSAAGEVMEKYGAQMRSEQDAAAALRAEFEDTPELDEAIRNAQMQLAQTKGERRQPGFFDFIALALMNLSGMDPRVAAEGVLGTGRQEQREDQQEDLLANLEVRRAGEKSAGRRQYRADEAGAIRFNRKMDLERELAEAKTSQQAADRQSRDEHFRASMLGRIAGQEGSLAGQTLDQTTRNKAMQSREVIKKALGLTDQQLNEWLRQQQQMQQGQPQSMVDPRQSRMFGGLSSGSFA